MRQRLGGERGEAAALEMMFVIGFLLLPTLVGLAQIPLWVDASSTGELAAQEAARQVALSTDFDTGVAAADAIALQIVVNFGWGEDASVTAYANPAQRTTPVP